MELCAYGSCNIYYTDENLLCAIPLTVSTVLTVGGCGLLILSGISSVKE